MKTSQPTQGLTIITELAARLGEFAVDRGEADVLAAWAALAPDAVAEWLTDKPQDVRDALSLEQIGRTVKQVLDRVPLANSPNAVPVGATLLREYGALLDAATLERLVSLLPPDTLTDHALQNVMERALQRWPAAVGLVRALATSAIAAGDNKRAHDLLNRLARLEDTQATAVFAWRARESLDRGAGSSVRCALLGSYTLEPLLALVDLECRELGLRPELYSATYGAWARELLSDASGLRDFAPEIVFLALSIDDLAPALEASDPAGERKALSKEVEERVISGVQGFRSWSEAPLIVHSFHTAFRDPAVVPTSGGADSRSRWLAELNARMADRLAEFPHAFLLDVQELLVRRAGGGFEDTKMRHLAGFRLGYEATREVARAYAGYIAPHKGLTRKCIVVDLDDTLWGGIIGEDGLDGIRLGTTAPGSVFREFQAYLRSMSELGFLLAVNSKNNRAEALEAIRTHEYMLLREGHFASMQINWRPKPENMLAIADELNLGLDSFVFIDDNPHERELMRRALPEVLTPELPSDPSLFRRTVELLPQLQKLQITETDGRRRQLYRVQRDRDRERVSAGSFDEYLRSLEIELQIGNPPTDAMARVAQLFQRTNQFNLTTRRYDLATLAKLRDAPASSLYALLARDRFGDHGLVASALVRTSAEEWRIDCFLMSCRVIGYGIESALLAAVCEDASAAKASRVVGEYVETEKNRPARDFYERHGFVARETVEGVTSWLCELGQGAVTLPPWLKVRPLNAA